MYTNVLQTFFSTINMAIFENFDKVLNVNDIKKPEMIFALGKTILQRKAKKLCTYTKFSNLFCLYATINLVF